MEYIIPAALALAVGVALWLLKRDRLKLEYELIDSETFPREGGVGRYHIFRLYNSGNKVIQDAKIKLRFSVGKIESTHISDPELITEATATDSQFDGLVPLLNPKEQCGVTITTIGDEQVGSPAVTARAIGVTATPRSGSSSVSVADLVFMVIAIMASIGVSFAVSQILLTDNIERVQGVLGERLSQLQDERDHLEDERDRLELEYSQGKPQTEQIVFAILNRNNLGHLLPQLIATGEGIVYWKTGLFLMHHFLLDHDNQDNYIEAMKSLVASDHVRPSSRGFTLYLLGKMEQHRGNSDLAMEYLSQCRKDTPLMYDLLMEQDPAYDLKKLEQWLMANQERTGP